MNDAVEEFKEQFPSLESYWRSIILFGRNVASYKFALAKSLLELAPTGKSEITLEELAMPQYSLDRVAFNAKAFRAKQRRCS